MRISLSAVQRFFHAPTLALIGAFGVALALSATPAAMVGKRIAGPAQIIFPAFLLKIRS